MCGSPARSIGENAEPASVKFTGTTPKDVQTEVCSGCLRVGIFLCCFQCKAIVSGSGEFLRWIWPVQDIP